MARRAIVAAAASCVFGLSLFLGVILPDPVSLNIPDPSYEAKFKRLKDGKAKPDRPDEAVKWYYEQRAYPAGAIPTDWRERALDHISQHNVPRAGIENTISWSAVGPNNIGGRTRTIAVDPISPSILYAGSVSGGVWKSTNSGTSWFATGDFADNLAITSIVIDPTNTSVIYAATGEGFFNIDAIRGAGVLKSTNAGTSWTLLTSFSGGSFPYHINDLYLRPDSTNIIYAASNTGLFRTVNSGTSWAFVTSGTSSARATQIVAHSSTPRTIYVSFGNFSTDGIYKTTNGGAPFSKLAGGFPTSGFGRVSMTIAPSNASVLYAAATNSSTNQTFGIYKTTNAGSTWIAVTTPTDPISGATHLAGQGWYNNVLGVSPSDENTVYVGGINLFKSTNGGSSWTMVSNWYTGAGYPYVHADQHDIVFSGSTIWFGNDGGIFRSTNAGSTFTEHNSGYATIQFYSGAVHPSSEVYYGGTQDNGTLRSGAVPTWSMVFGGDGGHTAVDYTTPTTVYTEYVYLNIQKSTNSGTSWTKSMTGIPSGPGPFDGTTDRCQFIAPFTMDPTDPLRIAAGTYRVFYTTTGASSWSAISTDLTGDGTGGAGSTITAIGIAKTSSATIYIGTSGSGSSASRIQVTTNTGTSWTNVTVSPLPNRYVTRIAVDPGNADRAWASYSGYNTSTPATPGHIFLTTNGGSSWANVSGTLPDIPVNAIAINPGYLNYVVVGTDLGVFETTNGGTAWTQQNTGMANVSVADLDLRGDKFLFAATHGRGMFKSTSPLVGVVEGPGEVVSEFRLMQNYPNPFNPVTNFQFTIGNSQLTIVKVYDIQGREVATLVNEQLGPGSYERTFNAGGLASGVYVYKLMAGSFTEAKKMVVMK